MKTNSRTNLLFALGALALTIPGASSAAADNPGGYLSLDDILGIQVQVASTTPKTIFNTPSTTSVITREAIERNNFRTVSEALNSVAGVRVLRGVAARGQTTIRGVYQETYANKVLVMINGVPTWDSITGDTIVDRVSVQEIERIEVLRGPASVLYGTNAYAGAVNIVLREATSAPAGSMNLAAGTFNEHQSGAFYAMPFDGGSFSVAGYGSSATGHTEWMTDNSNIHGRYHDFYTPTDFTAHLKYGSHDLLVNGVEMNAGFIGSAQGKFQYGVGNHNTYTGWLASYTYKHDLVDNVHFKLHYSHDYYTRHVSYSQDDFKRLEFLAKRDTIDAQANVGINDHFNADVGVETEYRDAPYMRVAERYSSAVDLNLIPTNRHSLSYSTFAQLNANFDKISAVVGGRFTSSKDYKSDFSPRATFLYGFDEKTTLKLNYGQSFRIPAVREALASTDINSPLTLGNSGLKPEKNTTYEIAFLKGFENVFAQALAYYSVYDNRIYRKVTPTSVNANQTTYWNASENHAYGVDLDAQYKNPEWVDLTLGYSYVKGSKGDVTADNYYAFKMVPHNIWTLGAQRAVGDWDFSALYSFTGKRTGPVSTIASQGTVDLNVAWRYKSTRHGLKLLNAFNNKTTIPDFVIRGKVLNEVPAGKPRQLFYTFNYTF